MSVADPALPASRDPAGLRVVLLRLGVLAVVLAAWQWVGDDSTRLAMPTVTRTLGVMWTLVQDGRLPLALLSSNVAMVAGYLAALAVGIPLGLAMGGWRGASQVGRPFLTILIAVPMIAMIPLIQTIFGPALASRIVVVFLFSIVYIALNTEVGARSVPPELLEMAASFGASRWQRVREVVLPHAFRSIMAGARLGLGRAIAGMVLAELFLVGSGIGSLLSFYRSRMNTGAVFAIVLTLVVEGIVIMALARLVEARVNRARGLA